MKKFIFAALAFAALSFAACGNKTESNCEEVDTIYDIDTVYIEVVDSVPADSFFIID